MIHSRCQEISLLDVAGRLDLEVDRCTRSPFLLFGSERNRKHVRVVMSVMHRLISTSVSAALAYLQAANLAHVLLWTLPFKLVVDGPYREIAAVGLWLGPIVALVVGAILSRSRSWTQVPLTLALCPVVFWAYFAVVVSGEGHSVFEPHVDVYSGTVFTTRALLLIGGGTFVGLLLATLIPRVSQSERAKPSAR